MNVSWTIDGKPVLMSNDWTASARVNFGFDRFTGKILEEDLTRLRVRQFSIIRGYLPDGTLLYEGRVTRPPTVRRGVAELEAQGHGVKAEKANSRLLYASRDFSLWGLAESPPYNAPGQVPERMTRQVESNCLRWAIPSDTVFAQNDRGGVSAGCAGSPGGFTRIKWDWASDIGVDWFTMEVLASNYPASGTDGTTASSGISVANSGTNRTVSLTGVTGNTRQRITLYLRQVGFASSAFTPGFNYLLKNLVLNGIATGDTMSTSAVTSDIFTRLGFNTSLVQTTSMNVLPYDVRDGQSWAEALSYMAILEDYKWGVWGTTDGVIQAEFSPWTKVWTTDREHGCHASLAPLERFNRAVVTYQDPAGTPQEVTASVSPDPLSGTGQSNDIEISLQDVQADSTVATNVANKAAAREASASWTGAVELFYLRDTAGKGNPYHVRPGELLRIADFDDPTLAHRIMEVEYRANGVRVEIGTASLETLIGKQLPYLGPPPELPILEEEIYLPPAFEPPPDPGLSQPDPRVPEVPEELYAPPSLGGGGGDDALDDPVDDGRRRYGHDHKVHHGGRKPPGGFNHPHRRHH